MNITTRRMAAAAALMASAVSAPLAHATPIAVTDPYHYLLINSPNTLGIVPGVRQNLGAQSVVPNGGAGTTAIAIQGATQVELPWFGTTVFSNEFSRSIAADPALFNPWSLRFTNGSDVTTINTPAITTSVPMPFVRSAQLSGSTVSWALPSDARIDAVRINVRDHAINQSGTGTDIVYNATFNRTTTSVTLPAVLANGLPLNGTHRYTVEVSLIDATTNSMSFLQAQILNRSRLYVDFTPTAAAVQLPIVAPGAGGSPTVYHFDIASVVAGTTYALSPFVAMGYDFATGAGNPNVRSVLLPAGIGDDQYTIVLANGQSFAVAAGTAFDFGPAGVSAFSVRGIESEGALDPLSATAFITRVTFTGAGEFTGTMTAVPEPAAGLMLLAGLGALGFAKGRR